MVIKQCVLPHEGLKPVQRRQTMTIMMKVIMGGVGLAALASAPAAAQYSYYPQTYYPYRISTQAAVDRCSAAVQNRLSYRTGYYGGYRSGRVVAVTRVDPRRNSVRVAGLASSGRMAYNYGPYGPYGIGAYGMLGSSYYNQAADLRFGCTVDMRGRVIDLDLNRR